MAQEKEVLHLHLGKLSFKRSGRFLCRVRINAELTKPVITCIWFFEVEQCLQIFWRFELRLGRLAPGHLFEDDHTSYRAVYRRHQPQNAVISTAYSSETIRRKQWWKDVEHCWTMDVFRLPCQRPYFLEGPTPTFAQLGLQKTGWNCSARCSTHPRSSTIPRRHACDKRCGPERPFWGRNRLVMVGCG